MASSSNRHWPSMFKSKPSCNTHHHHEWRSHDSNNLLSSTTACHRSALTTSGCEERSPEPKPRWNPKPEQIRILESIFNSGMVNPPRDEIRKIRAQLQEYGQVGDANVFYWFQNRKSRSKLHKSRHLLKSQATIATATATATTTATTSSSSSEKSKSSVDLILKSPTASVDQQPQPYFQEPLFFTTLQPPTTEGFCFSKLGNVFNPHQTVGSDLLIMNIQQNGILNSNYFKSHVEQDKMMKMSTAFTPTCIVPPNLNPTTTTLPSTITDFQGMEEPGPRKSTVFINDVAFEVTVGPFNVREAFGDDAVLVHSYGQPVLTNDCGVTLQPLQHGAFYYLVRSLSYDRSNAIDVI